VSEPLLTVQQVAKILGLSSHHLVRDLIDSGKLQAINLALPGKQRCLRIKREWVDTLIANSELPAKKPTRQRDNGNLRPSKFSQIGVTR
jgi:excisionase family DNA binding protein